jgi:hypothetical protein
MIKFVKWRDSATVGGWTRNRGSLSNCETIGFLVREDDECIVLAQTRCTDYDFISHANLHIIDKKSIVESHDIE